MLWALYLPNRFKIKNASSVKFFIRIFILFYKVSISDEILADREETIESLHQQVKKLEKRTRELSSELDAAQEDARRADAKWKEAEERSRRFKGQSHDNKNIEEKNRKITNLCSAQMV
jgi:chromosome segregation ATPase